MRFDFNEANILNQNLFSSTDDKKVLLGRLDNIYQNTNDDVLKQSLQGLIKKIEGLSDEEIKRILFDIIKKRFIVTSNYKVIYKN